MMLDVSGSMNWYPSGQGNEKFANASDVTFDSQGNKYVAIYDGKIIKYDSSDEIVISWGNYDDGGNTELRRAYAIDIDSNDRIYVTSHEQNLVKVFDKDGNYLSQFSLGAGSRARGIAIDRSDPANNRIYVANGDGDVEVYNTSGARLATWANIDGAELLAVDKNSPANVYMSRENKIISKYDSNGNPVNSYGGGTRNFFTTSNNTFGIDVDSSGDIFVGDKGDSHKVYKYNSAGVLQQSFGGFASDKFKNIKGISIDSNGKIWISDSGNKRIKKLNDGELIKIVPENIKIDVAKEVIKDIVSSTSLTDGANFGLVTWNSYTPRLFTPISSDGASNIYRNIGTLSAGGGTLLGNAMSFAESYLLGSNSPINNSLTCQKTIIIVVSDGQWFDHTLAMAKTKSLYQNHDIKTFTIGFGSGSLGSIANYTEVSKQGGTYPESPAFASNWNGLYDSLASFILQSIQSNLTFSAPTIMPEVAGNDHIVQATFKYKAAHQWKGYLNKYALDASGNLGALQWEAGEKLATLPAADRKIWTVNTGLSLSGYNNFVKANLSILKALLLERSPNVLSDVQLEGLIDFVRGVDTYSEFSRGKDDDNDTILVGERWKLADIYHSRAVAVGKPFAIASATADTKTEAYYRHVNGYNTFKTGAAGTRDEVIYAGSNAGMLHAFDSLTGEEKWAFVPPSIIPNFVGVITNIANTTKPIYGVDGEPVVKDIYYGGKWRTVLMSGLRQGGNSYFALDVTDPNAPQHLFTFRHDPVLGKVSYWNASGTRTDYSTSATVPAQYNYSQLGESWSKPLILRLPVGTEGAMKWVAVFGGGYNGGINPNYGNRLYVLDLEDGGKIIKNMDMQVGDIASNGIVTSVPPRVSAVIPDTSTNFQGASMPSGAVIYFSDLEGKLWKINMTDQGILYETKRLFNAESTRTNTRYTFHENTLSIDADGALWQYYGSGDQQSLGDISASISNRAFAFRHKPAMTDFTPAPMKTVANMANTLSSTCPTPTQDGWYFNLDANEKVTAKAAVKNAFVYFSRYTANSGDACSAGLGRLTEHSYTCGLLEASFNLGKGVPTAAIVYKNKIYIGISTDEATATLPSGWTKQGNLIIGAPSNLATGKVEVESWWEEF
jgi:type IV pilus assembly protein PilY1